MKRKNGSKRPRLLMPLPQIDRGNDGLAPRALASRTVNDQTAIALAVALYGVAALPALGMLDLRRFMVPGADGSGPAGGASGGGGH